MDPSVEQSEQKRLVAAAIEAAIRIGVLGALAYWCIQIIAPFALLLIWGAIIAVAVFPLYSKLERVFGGRKGLAATVMGLGLLLVLLVPVLLLMTTLVDGIQALAQGLREGTLHIPPPPDGVAQWPIIGKQLASVWAAPPASLLEGSRAIRGKDT